MTTSIPNASYISHSKMRHVQSVTGSAHTIPAQRGRVAELGRYAQRTRQLNSDARMQRRMDAYRSSQPDPRYQQAVRKSMPSVTQASTHNGHSAANISSAWQASALAALQTAAWGALSGILLLVMIMAIAT